MVFPMVIQQSPRNENWKLSFDCYDAPIVGRGSSGTVFAIDQHLVFKSFTEDEEGQLDLERESSIYLQLQSEGFSQYIVRFVEVWEDGLVLERQGSSLRSCLRGKLQPMDKQRAQWVKETSNALAFLHKKGIMHGDVGCHNFLVDEWGHVKLCDFAGSARAGETARVCYEARGRHPDYRSGEPTPRTEIFSLGSTIFEIYTSHAPYSSESESVVRQKYSERKFPLSTIKCLKVREIVEKCWNDEYEEVAEVCAELSSVYEGFLPPRGFC